jgi:hypothetical protein
MMCCGQERGKNFWIKRAIFIPIAIVAGVFIFGSAIMLLWNCILPAVLGLKTITFWQALGILVLSKILFGGFGCRHGHHRCHCQDWNKDCTCISPEEREKMKAEWRERCDPPVKQE